MKLTCGRAKDDPEKAVLPALIFTAKTDGGISAYALSLGWWDFHITLLWSRRNPAHD